MYPLSQFAIEKSAFRVAGGPREAIPFFAFKNLLTLLRKKTLNIMCAKTIDPMSDPMIDPMIEQNANIS